MKFPHFSHYLFATTTKSCICGHSTRVYTQASRLPAASSYPWSHRIALGLSCCGGGGGRGTHRVCARTQLQRKDAACALPTVFCSLDCQQRQVWAAGSSFIHFRGIWAGGVWEISVSFPQSCCEPKNKTYKQAKNLKKKKYQ